MTGTKRNAEGNMTPLKKVTKRIKEGSDELDDTMIMENLDRTILKKHLIQLEAFKITLMEEFCKKYNLDAKGNSLKEIIKCLMKKGYIDTDLAMTVDGDEIIISDEVAKFQRGKLEGIFQGKPATADVVPFDTKDMDLDNKALRELEKYKVENIWIRSELVNVRQHDTPSFKVSVKDSRNLESKLTTIGLDTRDPENKWTTIGLVPVRDPSIWGNIPLETRKEVIYAEINASGH